MRKKARERFGERQKHVRSKIKVALGIKTK